MVNYLPTSGGMFGGRTANRPGQLLAPLTPESGASPSMSREQFEELSIESFNQVNQRNVGMSAWEQVQRFGRATLTDTADSVWSSPINPARLVTSVERGDIWSMASSEQREFYNRNKPAIEGTSAVVGGIASAVFAEALIIPRVATALASSTAITSTRLWQHGKRWGPEAQRAMLEAQEAAIREGTKLRGLDAFGGGKMLAYQTAAKTGLVTRTLPFDYAVMWNNEAFNSGDLAEESFWLATGVGIGGALGGIAARGIARRSMNAPWARTAISNVTPMAGATNALLAAADVNMPKPIGGARNPAGARLEPMMHTKDSTEITEYLIGSRANAPDGMDTPPNVQSKLSRLHTQYKDQAVAGFARVLNKGLAGVGKIVREKADAMPEIRHLTEVVAKEDPYAVMGMDELALVDMPFKDALKERQAFQERLFQQANAQTTPSLEARLMAQQAAKMKKQEVYAFADGTWHDPESELVEAMRLHSDKDVRMRTKMEGDSASFKPYHSQGVDITLGPDMVPRRGNKRVSVAQMNHRDRFALWHTADRLMNKRARQEKKTITEIRDDKATDWFALDMLDEMMDVDESLVKFGPDNTRIMDRDGIKRHSLRLKARELLRTLSPSDAITEEMRLRYNLPAPTTMELLEDPSGDAFRVWLKHAASDVGSADELSQALTSGRATHGLDLLPTDESYRASLKGNGIRFNRTAPNKQGESQWMRPMLATFEPRDVISNMIKRGHEESMLRIKSEQLGILGDDRNSMHLAAATRSLTDSPVFAMAHKVNELHDAQNTGLGNRIGQALSEFLPTKFKGRDNPIFQAAQRIQEVVDRMSTRAYVSAVQAAGLEGALTRYGSRAGLAMRAELDQFVSLRPGWDIKEITDMGEGRFGFVLDDTPVNRKLLGVDKVEKDSVLTNMRTGEAITLGEEALDVMDRYWKGISGELLKGTNALREANNQARISAKKFFVPTRDTRGMKVGFVQGPDGRIVPGSAIVEATDEAYERAKQRTLEEFGDGFTVESKEGLASVRDVWDMEAMDWMDHGTTSALRGGPQEGGLTPAFVRDGAFMDMMDNAKRIYRSQHQDLVKTVMKHPIQIARMHSGVERQLAGEKRVGKVDLRDDQGTARPSRNIYDEFEQALTGTSQSFQETGLLSRMSDAIESGLDATLTVPIRHIADIAVKWGVRPDQLRAAKNHAEIVKVLGEHSPYKSANDWLEAQGVRRPATIRSASQKLNALATNLVLRWDPFMAHASLNMLGLIPTILGNVKAGAAPSTMALQVKNKKVPLWDGMAIIKGAIADMTNVKRMGKDQRATHADWAKMVENGDASQSSFEYHLAVGAVRSKSDFDVFLGKIDERLAWASDGSENLSRQVSHFTGLRLARYQGITDIDEAHDFAREFANAAIADYAPSNRPELYQTSFGSVFGLFQSYAMNQYTKMFHWLEKGDYAAFGMQAAAQATLFGLPSAYGANALFSMHDKFFQDSGEPSLMDRMYNQFGPTLGNAIAHGGLAEVMPFALWTRGDMTPRMPVITPGMVPPGVDVVRRFVNMTVGSASKFLSNTPADALPAAIELIQREMPNRVLKGTLGVIQGGYETDRSGNVIHTNDHFWDSIARVAGVRSSRQQIEMNAYFAGRADMQRDARRREKLRNRFRTDVRRAAQRGEQVDPAKYFDDYVASGGNPRSYRSWFRDIVRDAASPRAAAQMRSNLESPKNRIALWRYGGYGAWDIDDTSSVPNQ